MTIGSTTISNLADVLALDRTTLTRNLRSLSAEELVVIAPGEDRRERVITLTEAGEAAVHRAMPYWHDAQTKIMDHFGGERWRRLLDDLAELSMLASIER